MFGGRGPRVGAEGEWKPPWGLRGISVLMPVRVYVSSEFRKIGEINVVAEWRKDTALIVVPDVSRGTATNTV